MVSIELIGKTGCLTNVDDIELLAYTYHIGKYNDINRYTAVRDKTQPITDSTLYQLSDVELFYLVCITCLQSNSDNSNDNVTVQVAKFNTECLLSIQQLYRILSSLSTTFILRYCVYKQYKDIGYTVRSGLKYGCDYIIYNTIDERKNKHQHGIYSIDIIDKNDKQQQYTSNLLINKIRINTSIAKTYTACYVDITSNTIQQLDVLSSKATIDDGIFIQQFNSIIQAIAIQPITLKRFQPSSIQIGSKAYNKQLKVAEGG